MNVLFAISASSSTAQVVWRPLYARFWAASRQQIFESGLTGSVSGLDVASLATGLFTSAWWFFNRHASYAWALQVCDSLVYFLLLTTTTTHTTTNTTTTTTRGRCRTCSACASSCSSSA